MGRKALLPRMLWNLARFPVLALCVVMEPVVSFVFGASALLLTLTGGILRLTSGGNVPLWGMLATAVGCVTVLWLYRLIILALM